MVQHGADGEGAEEGLGEGGVEEEGGGGGAVGGVGRAGMVVGVVPVEEVAEEVGEEEDG